MHLHKRCFGPSPSDLENVGIEESSRTTIEKPELVNTKPYEDGWMLRVKLADKAELQKLLSAEDYRSHIGETPGSGGD